MDPNGEAEMPSRTKQSGDTVTAALSSAGLSRDDQELLQLGKQPVLKRNFGFMSILGFACTVLITWEGITAIIQISLLNGGTAGVIWSFLIVWIGTLSVFTTLSELASMAPVAAGQYHWVALLAPESWSSFLSYLTAWVTVIGWQAVSASASYFMGLIIQSLVALTHPSYMPKPYQTMLFTWFTIIVCALMNILGGKFLAKFESVILVLHLAGFLLVLGPLVYYGPVQDGSVFTKFYNGGGWSSTGLSFLVGLPGPVFSLIGADSVVHVSEEISNASVNTPRAMIWSIFLNGILGFAMVLGLMFSIGDVETAIGYQQTYGFTAIGIYFEATNSRLGACLMGVVVAILYICGTVGAVTASSRIFWSFARDNGLPFSKFFSQVNARTSLPINAVLVTLTITILLSLIVLGSSVIFNDLLSIVVLGLYSSYFLAASLLLHRRTSNKIAPHSPNMTDMVRPGNLRWGRWRVPEPFGTINNVFACIFLVLIAFWSTWPPAIPVEPATMNYSVLVFGGVVIFSIVWWIIRARHNFTGPLNEISGLDQTSSTATGASQNGKEAQVLQRPLQKDDQSA